MGHRPAETAGSAFGRTLAIWGVLLTAVWAAPTRAAEPVEVTDEAVEAAIQKAVSWLWDQRNDFGHWEPGSDKNGRNWAGDSALVLLALLYAGEKPTEDRLDRNLDWLAGQTLNGTYVVGLRAQVLALVGGKKYLPRLREDVSWLVDNVAPRSAQEPGTYDYIARPGEKSNTWDNSVTQFGVLGTWMAADAGVSVPEDYWEMVGEHFLHSQKPDGGWDYGKRIPGRSSGSMTAAGVAALFITLDQRYADRPKEAAGFMGAINRGLDWLGREYGPENPHGNGEWQYYYLYGIERAGRASGRKYFRNKDWFHSAATYLLEHQAPQGHWPGGGDQMSTLRNTALALLVLCHSRAPLLFNKLELGAEWDHRLRDVANLTRYAGHSFERLLNWQTVTLDGTMEDLLEAPVLYLYGESACDFDDVQVQKLREYCRRGGLIFAVAGGAGFRTSIENLAARAFPEYAPRALPPEHPLFSGAVQFPIDDPPLVLEVSSGVRTLLLLATRDLAGTWNRYTTRGKPAPELQLGANVYLYATDKTTIRSRLQTPAIPLRQTEIERTIRVARLKYDGHWDVEPYGWTRLAAYMNNEAHTRLLVTTGVTLDAAELKDFTVAYISGTGRFELTPDEQRGLREFLTGGGTLLADAAGGAREFTAALEDYVQRALRRESHVLPSESPLLTGAGLAGASDLKTVGHRRAARSTARGAAYPRLSAFSLPQRLGVIYTSLDLSVGLLGTPVYDVQGFEPGGALQIMRNLLLYAALPTAEKARLEP
jgi:hypothetical protein